MAWIDYNDFISNRVFKNVAMYIHVARQTFILYTLTNVTDGLSLMCTQYYCSQTYYISAHACTCMAWNDYIQWLQ